MATSPVFQQAGDRFAVDTFADVISLKLSPMSGSPGTPGFCAGS